MEKISTWLNQKFLEWQNEKGMPQKQKDFAAYIGVKPTTYSSWVNDGVPPSGENLYKLADKLGFEVFDIVGAEPPSPVVSTLKEAQEAYERLSPEEQIAFLEKINKIIVDTLEEFGAKKVK